MVAGCTVCSSARSRVRARSLDTIPQVRNRPNGLRAVLGMLDRYPFNSPWVIRLVSRYGLPVWFGAETLAALVQAAFLDRVYLYFDARLYLMASQRWLAGGDPWDVHLLGNHFAAPPLTLLAVAPLAVLPTDVGVAIIAGLVMAASLATVRMLRLPWWWLLFPPLVQCVLSANIHALVVPLVLLRGGPLAVFVKLYAAVPLVVLGRWRAIAAAVGILLLTATFLPWAMFLERYPAILARLAAQTKLDVPPAMVLVLSPLILWSFVVIGRSRAAWLAVPAIWPSPQFYYATIALPARSQIAGAILALPVPGAGLAAVVVLALVTARNRRRAEPEARDPVVPIGQGLSAR